VVFGLLLSTRLVWFKEGKVGNTSMFTINPLVDNLNPSSFISLLSHIYIYTHTHTPP